nr:AMP-binding protein [Nocardioides immobilis]
MGVRRAGAPAGERPGVRGGQAWRHGRHRYRGQPEKTAETIDAEGWLHTGDVATTDDDGYVTAAALARDPGVQAQVAEAVEAANARLSRVEQIKKHRILETDWLPGGDELTPTMKLKRRPIGDKYADLIEGLYADA